MEHVETVSCLKKSKRAGRPKKVKDLKKKVGRPKKAKISVPSDEPKDSEPEQAEVKPKKAPAPTIKKNKVRTPVITV